MQFLLDNVVATAVVVVLAMMLVAVSLGRQDEAVALAEHHATAGRAASIGHMLRQDFESAMAIESASAGAVDLRVVLDVPSMTVGTLRYRPDSVAGGAVQVVRVDQAGAEAEVGPPVRDWSVTLLDAAGAPTAVPDDARSVRVRIVSQATFVRAADSLDVVWEREYAPSLLGPRTF